MLTITNQSDYGMLVIEQLKNKKKYYSLSDLVKTTHLPKRFLARISSVLAKNDIIESKEGRVGGYMLSANLDKITLYDYLKIFEKDLTMAKCFDEDFTCPYDKICSHKSQIKKKLNKIIIRQLKDIKLSQLFEK